MTGDGTLVHVGFFDRLMARGGLRRSPEWEMLFPGFTYRLWRVSDVDVDQAGFKWAWEAHEHGKPREIHSAETRSEAVLCLRRRVVEDLGPLVAGLGRFVQHERDWCFACGRTLDLGSRASP